MKTKTKRNFTIRYAEITPGFEWICRQCKATNNERGVEITDVDPGTKFKCGLCNATHTFKV